MATSLLDYFKENPGYIVYTGSNSIEKETLYYIKVLIKNNPSAWNLQVLTYFFQKFKIPAKRANYNTFDKNVINKLKKSGDLIWKDGSFTVPPDVYNKLLESDYENSLEKELLLRNSRSLIWKVAKEKNWPSPGVKTDRKKVLFPKIEYGAVLSTLYNYIYKNFIYPEYSAYIFVDEYYNEL